MLVDRWAVLQHAWRTRRSRRRLAKGGDVEAAGSSEEERERLLADLACSTAIPLLHSDAERREFISAGAAAGLAVHIRLVWQYIAESENDCCCQL